MQTHLLEKAPMDATYILSTFRVARRARLSPSFIRITFKSEDGFAFDSWGPDQRVKLYLPEPGQKAPRLPLTDWNTAWARLAPEYRPARLSSTIRAIRPESD